MLAALHLELDQLAAGRGPVRVERVELRQVVDRALGLLQGGGELSGVEVALVLLEEREQVLAVLRLLAALDRLVEVARALVRAGRRAHVARRAVRVARLVELARRLEQGGGAGAVLGLRS